jgi:hypothetical protein
MSRSLWRPIVDQDINFRLTRDQRDSDPDCEADSDTDSELSRRLRRSPGVLSFEHRCCPVLNTESSAPYF